METHSVCTLSALLDACLVLTYFCNLLIVLVSQAGFEPATCPLGVGFQLCFNASSCIPMNNQFNIINGLH